MSRRAWKTGAAALLTLSVLIVVVGRVAGRALVAERGIDRPDAIVSLGSHEWERLPETGRLAKMYPDTRVFLTLPQVINEFNCHDCGNRVRRLELLGVDPSRVIVLPLGRTGTYGEAVAARAYLKKERFSRLLIVTSPYHTRRSLATFEKVFEGSGVSLGIRPAYATSPARPDAWWGTQYDRWYVRYEWSAIPYYWARYGVSPFP